MAESIRYLCNWAAELPVLAGLLPQIDTPVQIIAGARDAAVPPVNAEFLHQRLPYRKLGVIDADHFTWEDAAAEYAALVTSWRCVPVRPGMGAAADVAIPLLPPRRPNDWMV